MSSDYCLRIGRAEDLLWQSSFHNRAPDPYVLCRLGNVTRVTQPAKNTACPRWDQSFIFSLPDTSIPLVFTVKHKSAWRRDSCIGRAGMDFNDLVLKCTSVPGEVALDLSSDLNGQLIFTGRIFLRLDAVGIHDGTEISLDMAQEAIRRGKFRRSEGISDVTQSISEHISRHNKQSDLYQAVGALIFKLEAFKGVVDTLSEIHPLLTVAWRLSTALYSAVQNVFETDQKIVNLVHIMEDAFDFVRDIERLPDKMARIQKPVVALLKQIAECCLFVSRYASQCFLSRMVDVSSSEKIIEFERTIEAFKQQIESGVTIHIAIVSMRTPRKIDDLLLLQRLVPSLSDAFDRPTCLPDTRVEIMGKICEWVVSGTEQNVFWLHGVAGSGKSTITTTVAQHFRDMSRLGASLYFERGRSEPVSVIRTLAYKLALFDASIGESILEGIEKDKDLSTTTSTDQFRKLLLDPLRAASTVGPVLVVVDALDECGTPDTRRNLMNLFQQEFPKLPKNFRFLFTSRREADIDKVFALQTGGILIEELDYTSSASHQDVLSYLRHAMPGALTRHIAIPTFWSLEDYLPSLCKAAGGLFIWASTAVKLVSNSDNPFRTLKNLATNSHTLANLGLGGLYTTVLRDSGINWDDSESTSRFVAVLSLLLYSKVRLSIETIDGILGFPLEESSELVLSRLRCLLSYSQGEPVHLFHASFGDYLTSTKHSREPWSIDTLDANRLILNRCFSTMENLLRFNICDLETSFVRNEDVPGLKDRVKERIPPHLEYACIHWAQHLRDVPSPSDVIGALMDFAHNRLLFWFEVLSLIGSFRQVVCNALLESAEWTKGNNADFTKFLRDAADLATVFAKPIVECTPHIYVTMIPLSKDESLVSALYSERMTSLVQVQRKGLKRPLKYVRVLEGHESPVDSVSVSPDGRIIASGEENGTVRIWDFHGGEELKVFEHGGSVRHVRFLPDGKHIVSASEDGAVRVWDIETGESIHRTLLGCAEDNSAFSVSPDGTRAASRRKNGAVVVWNISDETELARFDEHTDLVCSVAFSCDGKFFASGEENGTVRVWDIENKKPAFGRLDHVIGIFPRVILFSPYGKHIMHFDDDVVETGEVRITILGAEGITVAFTLVLGFDNSVRSAAWSPCGMRIVVGCGKGDVMVLNATNGEVVCSFKGHTNGVDSLCFSPDGRYVISGSWDGTVRIWDTTVENGNSGDQYYADTVVISDDGSRVASGSWREQSIVIWDADSGDVISGPLSGCVDHMVFSSDNSRLVSSFEKTIRVWDVESGQLAFDFYGFVTSSISAVSPDNAIIVSAGVNGIFVRDMATGKTTAGPIIRSSADDADFLEFSPDGKRLASCSSDEVIVWSTETWQVVCEFETSDCVAFVRFSPDSTQIATLTSPDERITLWDAEKGRILLGPYTVPSQGKKKKGASLIFTQNGLYVASQYGTSISITRFDPEGMRTVGGFDSRSHFTFSHSRDGSRIASMREGDYRSPIYFDPTQGGGAHDENMMKVWDVSDLIQVPGNHEEGDDDSFQGWTMRDDGWLIGGPDRRYLLFWIPHDLRETLLLPRNVRILNRESSTKLDFDGAALGNRWRECFISS